ncbi:MAG TPA: FkbM family methyltransferase [Acetobacteraceae bacterium]
MHDLQIPLDAWRPAHTSSVATDEQGRLIFSDGTGHTYHLMRFVDPRARGATIRLSIAYRPAPGCSTDLHVDHWGGITICDLTADGRVARPGVATAAEVERGKDGLHLARITYFSSTDVVALGTAAGTSPYRGNAAPQYIFESIRVEIAEAAPIAEAERIVVVDVGARGGLSPAWRRAGALVRPILFEPAADARRLLEAEIAGYAGGQVHPVALYNRRCIKALHLTAEPGCASLLRPDAGFLSRFSIAPWFEVTGEARIPCARYDELHREAGAPRPDVVKIDVQGAEYEVLQGFGALLDDCLAIELETHVRPIYRNQRLLPDIVALLERHEFQLAKLMPQPFDGALVEFNACFVKTPRWLADKGEVVGSKMRWVRTVWELG